MNKILSVPAVCCAAGFLALYAALGGADARHPAAPHSESSPQHWVARIDPIGQAEAHALVEELLLSPWRQWESSPRRLMTRALPRPPVIPEVTLAKPLAGAGALYVGTVALAPTAAGPNNYPLAIDRLARSIMVYSGDRWQTHDAWLKNHGPR